MADSREKDRRDLLIEMQKIQKEMSDFQSANDMRFKKNKEELLKLERQLLHTARELKTVNQERLDIQKNTESSISSLSSMYGNLKKSQTEILSISSQIEGAGKEEANAISNILQTTRELSSITADDSMARLALTNQYNDQLEAAERIFGANSDIVNKIKEQFTEADSLSKLTKEEKDILESQAKTYDTIKTKIASIGATLRTFLSRPQALVGGLVAGAGALVDKFADVNRQLGNGFDILNSTTASAGVLGFVFEDTAGTVKALASEFGGTEAATFQTQANIGLMATNMGISNTEAVSLSGSFARLNGNSTDIAADMVKTTQEFAKQNGVVPSALMADLAASTEEFALFGKDGGENILRAAGFASKLGTNMKTLSGIAEGLLDFESSITKELELGAMLGKNINLDRARQLALEGDIEGATNATLDALGGIEAFNEMDYFQKKATADLLGVSVGELQKMAQNQQNANSLGAVMNEKFSAVGETINAGLNKYLGTGLKGLGGMITMSGELGRGFKALGVDMGKITGSIGKGLKDLLMWPVKKIGGMFGGAGKSATESITSKATDSIGGGGKTPGGGIMEGMSKINMNAVLKGAAAMVIVAGAVFVFGKAVQEFMKVSWEAVGMAVVSMLALVGAVALLGAIMTSGVGAVAILAGAAAMLVIAASVLVLGNALQAIGTGFEMMATGIQTLMPQLMAVATTIGGLVTLIPSIALLAYSIMGLSGSLVALGVAGIVAAPGLMALSAVGAISTGLNSLLGGEEGGEGGDSALLEEIRGLRADLNDGKVGVYMDGTKVTAAISKVVNKVGSNSYAIT
jgi:hypothetical protein